MQKPARLGDFQGFGKDFIDGASADAAVSGIGQLFPQFVQGTFLLADRFTSGGIILWRRYPQCYPAAQLGLLVSAQLMDVLPERRVTVYSGDMGYTIGLSRGAQNALEGV
ncbi:MAG: hypothetical protein L0Y57_09535 [Beijerinckiaceae bacterium]|nr:hypothetical protein [Beijerinckiaceae bacterium]